MKKMNKMLLAPVTLALALILVPSAQAQDGWTHGIGTGISSFSLDGDIGFETAGGPVIFDVDLSNSDTSDLVESGFGVAGFAAKGRWKIGYKAGTVTLEDNDGTLNTEWDRTKIEVVPVYSFAKTGNHVWGVAFGVRYIEHDWTFNVAGDVRSVEESWTDAVIGLAHQVPFANNWQWVNRLQASFGGSEGTSLLSTALAWQVAEQWNVSFALNLESNEFEEGAPGDADFYLYDVDEPSIAVGFLYIW